MKRSFKKAFKHGGKVLVTTVCTVALVASQCGIALGLGSMTRYDLVRSAVTVDESYITIGTHNTGNYGEILGLTDVTWGTAKSNSVTTLADAETNATMGIFTTDLNENPSPYWANYSYNLWATANGADTVENAARVSGQQKPDSADITADDNYYGVSATLSLRPDILLGCDSKSFAEGNAIILREDGTTPVAVAKSSLATSGYTDMVDYINSLTSSDEGYQSGDEDYDPYYVELCIFYGDASFEEEATCSAYSIYCIFPTMYRLATAAEEILASDSSKTTRYDESPMEIAISFESYMRGLQDYVLAKIADGTTTKKSVACIADGGIDNDAKTATCYQSAPEGSLASADGAISVATEVLENVCDNIAGTLTDSYDEDGTFDGTYTNALTASDLNEADYIILEDSADEDALNQLFQDAGITCDAEVFVNEPSSSGIGGASASATNWGADNAMAVPVYLGFVYSDVINPVYALAYYYTEFWHVSSDSTTLANALGLGLGDMTLPSGITADLSGYSEADIEAAIEEGLAYYNANKSSIDSTTPKLKASSYLEEVLPSTTAQTITTSFSSKTVTYGSTTTLSLGAVASGNGTLSYSSSNTSVATVSTAGKVTIKGAGTAKITITAAAKGKYTKATKTVTIKVNKATNTLKLTKSKASVKSKKKSTVTIKTSKAKGKVTYKLTSKAKKAGIKVNAKGKVTVKKGTKKGTYKIKVKAKGNKNYKAATKTFKVVVK